MEDEMDCLSTNMTAITEFSARISGTLQDQHAQITKLSGMTSLIHTSVQTVVILACNQQNIQPLLLFSRESLTFSVTREFRFGLFLHFLLQIIQQVIHEYITSCSPVTNGTWVEGLSG